MMNDTSTDAYFTAVMFSIFFYRPLCNMFTTTHMLLHGHVVHSKTRTFIQLGHLLGNLLSSGVYNSARPQVGLKGTLLEYKMQL